MELHEIVSAVEQQMLRAARGKGPGGGRAQRWPEPCTVPGAVSLELLSALCTQEQVEQACRQARLLGAAAVTLPPYFLPLGRRLLSGSPTALTAAVGHPWGALTPRARTALAKDCMDAGADELEIALDLAAVKSGALASEQDALEELARLAQSGGRVMSILIDLKVLSAGELDQVLTAARRSGAAGVALRCCTDPGDVRVALELLGGQIAVKASGPVKSFDGISSLLCAGAARVGVANLEAIRRMAGWGQPAKAGAGPLFSDSL